MDIATLEVQTRDLSKRAKDLLAGDVIPAQYYGRGVENRSLQVDYQTFRRLYRTAGSNTVISMTVDGKDKMNVLVHDLQFDPITDKVKHVDFINVEMDKELHTQIPVALEGVAPAVKELGGILMHQLEFLDVKCLPKDLVHHITVNIESVVDFHSPVRVSDLRVPEGITLLNSPDDIVVTAVAPRIEEEAGAPTAESGAAGATESKEPAAGANAEGGENK